jgi:hypothetical protein
MKISYAITVCNEIAEIKRLIPFLLEHKKAEDEIVVLLDKPKAPQELLDFLYICSSNNQITLKESIFKGHFADWKNELNQICKGDFIFNIDADEMPHTKLIEILPDLLEENIECDVIAVPRVNTVEGLTASHVAKWGWQVNEHGWVNWPDHQWRIYKNKPHLKWVNQVHERIEGHKVWTHLPMMQEFALYHPKTIDRQERQNEYYNTL